MSISPTKPKYPANSDTESGIYPYLASVGMLEQTLRYSCIEKMRVIAINSPQTVTVIDSSGDTFPDVPVWIHTDVGSRLALIKGVENLTSEEYFKNAAHMFLFPGVGEETYTYVSVIAKTVDGVKVVYGVISVLSAFYSNTKKVVSQETHTISSQNLPDLTTPWPTYRPYFHLSFVVKRGSLTTGVTQNGLFVYEGLFDLLTGRPAIIPTYTGSEPGEPYHEASVVYKGGTLSDYYYYDNELGTFVDTTAWGTSGDSDAQNIALFLSSSVELEMSGIVVSEINYGDFYAQVTYNPSSPSLDVSSVDKEGNVYSNNPSYQYVPEDYATASVTGHYGGSFTSNHTKKPSSTSLYLVGETNDINTVLALTKTGSNESNQPFTYLRTVDATYTSLFDVSMNYTNTQRVSLYSHNAVSSDGNRSTQNGTVSMYMSNNEDELEKEYSLFSFNQVDDGTANGSYLKALTNNSFFIGFFDNFYWNSFIHGASVYGKKYNYSNGVLSSAQNFAKFPFSTRKDTGRSESYITESQIDTVFENAANKFMERLEEDDVFDDDHVIAGGMNITSVKGVIHFVRADLDIDRYEE